MAKGKGGAKSGSEGAGKGSTGGRGGPRPDTGFPGGNWPSATGNPSGGGRGNALSEGRRLAQRGAHSRYNTVPSQRCLLARAEITKVCGLDACAGPSGHTVNTSL
jgi:hypothetical protein